MGRRFKWDTKYLYWGITAFAVIACSILFFYLISRWRALFEALSLLLQILTPFLIGFLITYILYKPMGFFERSMFYPLCRKLSKKDSPGTAKAARAISVAFIEILMLALLAGVIALVLPQIISSIEKLISSADSYYRYIVRWITKMLDDYPELEAFFIRMTDELNSFLKNFLETVILPRLESTITNIYGGVTGILSFIVSFAIGVIISVYVLFGHERFSAQIKKVTYGLFKPITANRICAVTRFVDKVCGGFLTGKLIDSLIIAIICYAGLLIFNVPYAALVSVIVGITNIVPFFGPFIGAVPSAFIILLESPVKCLIFIIFIIVLQQIDGNIIGPKILGDRLGMNAFWIMFAIILFGGLFGFWGMLLGVPVFAVIYEGAGMLIKKLLNKRDLPETTEAFQNIESVDPETGMPVYEAGTPSPAAENAETQE